MAYRMVTIAEKRPVSPVRGPRADWFAAVEAQVRWMAAQKVARVRVGLERPEALPLGLETDRHAFRPLAGSEPPGVPSAPTSPPSRRGSGAGISSRPSSPRRRSSPEKYRNHVLVTRDGRVVTGQIIRNEFRRSLLHVATDPMNLEAVTKVSKRELVSREESPVSPMPAGLLDTLTREEILDLLAYLESGGRAGR